MQLAALGLSLLSAAAPAWPAATQPVAIRAGSKQGEPRKDYPKLSPFQAVRWKAERPEVQVDGRWYALVSIDGLSTDAILDHCRTKFGSKTTKRFEEDLVEVLDGLGQAPRSTCDLELTDLESEQAVQRASIAMTEANRRAIWLAAEERRTRANSASRVTRDHASAPPAGFEEVGCRSAPAGGEPMTAQAVADDLDALEWLLVQRYAYRDLCRFDFRAGLDAVRLAAAGGTSSNSFALDLAKVLARFGDGHSGVEDLSSNLGPPFLPCLVECAGEALVAVRSDRSAFVDDAHPLLAAIDGVALEEWLARAASIEARGSAALVRQRAVRDLRYLGALRGEMRCRGVPGMEPDSNVVRLTLASFDGHANRTLELPTATQKPIYGQRVRGENRLLDGRIGYLRIASMEDEPAFLDGLDAAMQLFRESKGLVIDVRGNGGGSRAALLRLFPYFMGTDEGPYVANVAAYRLAPGDHADEAGGFLADRWLFPLSSTRWKADERAAIERTARAFVPEWPPPAGEFSAWHYLVLSRADNPKAFVYRAPVVVLLDSACFSATDVFLAAFSGRPNVTLIGTSSGGGSGRALSYPLPNSRLSVRLSSMASFRRDGRLIDGRGIEPDLAVAPAPLDFIGRGDAQLDAALARLH